jgi:hypothetical protein
MTLDVNSPEKVMVTEFNGGRKLTGGLGTVSSVAKSVDWGAPTTVSENVSARALVPSRQPAASAALSFDFMNRRPLHPNSHPAFATRRAYAQHVTNVRGWKAFQYIERYRIIGKVSKTDFL